LNGEPAFTSCGFTRGDCEARGMFQRFGGVEFVPAAISVRTTAIRISHVAVAVNEARYNDFVPDGVWNGVVQTAIVFARNDGNLTRHGSAARHGEMQAVLKVLVTT